MFVFYSCLLNESGILAGENSTCNHFSGYKRFTNKIPHNPGVSCDMKDDHHKGMYYDCHTADSHITVDAINEEPRRKNELVNDETRGIDAETTTVGSRRDLDDGLMSVDVDRSYIEMTTFSSKERHNVQAFAPHMNDMCYHEVIPVDDDDVSLEIVGPHRRLYRDVDVGFTRSHVRDFDEEYGISHLVLRRGSSLMSCPMSSMPM